MPETLLAEKLQLIRTSTDPFVDRYYYDFGLCSGANGWAQIDTTKDDRGYGTWCNPSARQIFNFCEGDLTLTKCADDDSFVEQLRACATWHRGNGYWLGIDAGRKVKANLEALGLANLLH